MRKYINAVLEAYPKFCQFFSGSHADLIASGGEYCRMYNLHLSRLGMNDSTTTAS